jgi:hypothetical protein
MVLSASRGKALCLAGRAACFNNLVTFEMVRKIALGLDNVEEGTSYGTPAFKVNGVLFARLRDDIGALVVGMSMEDRQELMVADPETYFITDHYLDYPWILVRLSRVDPEAMRDLLRGAWRAAAASKTRSTKKRSKL